MTEEEKTVDKVQICRASVGENVHGLAGLFKQMNCRRRGLRSFSAVFSCEFPFRSEEAGQVVGGRRAPDNPTV